MNKAGDPSSGNIGFRWWRIWAILGLTLGNICALGALNEIYGAALVIMAANTVLCILILRYNKYAFLIATVLSVNPIVWIINGIYLKSRWNHPKVNGGR